VVHLRVSPEKLAVPNDTPRKMTE